MERALKKECSLISAVFLFSRTIPLMYDVYLEKKREGKKKGSNKSAVYTGN